MSSRQEGGEFNSHGRVSKQCLEHIVRGVIPTQEGVNVKGSIPVQSELCFLLLVSCFERGLTGRRCFEMLCLGCFV